MRVLNYIRERDHSVKNDDGNYDKDSLCLLETKSNILHILVL